MNELPYYVIDDEPETSDDHLGLSVALDPHAQMVILTQDDPTTEDDYDMVVLSLTELRRLYLIIASAMDEEGRLKPDSFEVHSVQ